MKNIYKKNNNNHITMRFNLKNPILIFLVLIIIAGCSNQTEENLTKNNISKENFNDENLIIEENNQLDKINENSNLSEIEKFALYEAKNFCNLIKASFNEDFELLMLAMEESEKTANELGFSQSEIENLTLKYEEDLEFQEKVLINVNQICPEDFATMLSLEE